MSEPAFLSLIEAAQKAAALGLPVAEHRGARTADEAVALARDIGYPVVVKVVSPLALHKSEVGGVKLSLTGDHEVRRAFLEIRSSFAKFHAEEAFEGVAVSPMLSPGLETTIGLTRDEELGPAIMFGLGGMAVEIYGDVVFRLPPLTAAEAHRMVREIRGYPLLSGFRGQTPGDVESLVECILLLSDLPQKEPAIVELEINPLILYPKGCRAADVRVAIEASGETKSV